jgi:hypothetical protein
VKEKSKVTSGRGVAFLGARRRWLEGPEYRCCSGPADGPEDRMGTGSRFVGNGLWGHLGTGSIRLRPADRLRGADDGSPTVAGPTVGHAWTPACVVRGDRLEQAQALGFLEWKNKREYL